MRFKPFIPVILLLAANAAGTAAQTVVTSLSDTTGRKTVSSLETDGDFDGAVFAAEGIIQDWQDVYDDFEKTVFSDLTGYIAQVRRQKQETQTKADIVREATTPAGYKIDLPQLIDENGVDLFYLTEDGISINLLLDAPSYFTDEQDLSAIIKWIRYYAHEKRIWTEKKLKRYQKLHESFEQAFADRGVPTELTLLSLQESGCNPYAVSPAGAVGVWQFMPATARKFGLNVSASVDERYDTYKSARAAASLLRANQRTLGSWTLALAAYNCGAGRIQSAINKAGGSRSWEDIEKYLPKETRNYIPGIIALYYIWTYREPLGFA